MREDRVWIYRARLDANRFLTCYFVERVEKFLRFAFNHEEGDVVSGGKIQCICAKCKNLKYLNRDTVTLHLYKKGFLAGYDTWYLHGESYVYECGSSSTYNAGVYGEFLVCPTVIDMFS